MRILLKDIFHEILSSIKIHRVGVTISKLPFRIN